MQLSAPDFAALDDSQRLAVMEAIMLVMYLRYVLLNARHHATSRSEVLSCGWVDPYSSALWFDGWKTAIRTDAPWLRALAKDGCPTAAPHTWLLAVGWRRGGGPIDIDDIPGPAP